MSRSHVSIYCRISRIQLQVRFICRRTIIDNPSNVERPFEYVGGTVSMFATRALLKRSSWKGAVLALRKSHAIC